MSNVSGLFSVNIEFRDSTTSGSVQSLKTIALRDTTEYTDGKVAIITGTAGTTAVNFQLYGQTPYRNSQGNFVSFTAASRLAFSWSGDSERILRELGDDMFLLRSSDSRVAMTDLTSFTFIPFIDSGSGTGVYTIVIYGAS